MAETATAVALLFDDGVLGEQLRAALAERGARIVHEGGLASLSRQCLLEAGADVLVVNLDDDDDAALDRLYEAIEGDRPRVVFNDAQASRSLDGWDRARWARHLAMKVLAVGDADPPRPAGAREVETAAPAAMPEPAEAMHETAEEAVAEAAVADDEPSAPADVVDDLTATSGDAVHHERTAAASETLAAELEALLADGDAVTDENEFGTGLNYAAGDGEALHDGDFGGHAEAGASDEPWLDDAEPAPAAEAGLPPLAFDGLALVPDDEQAFGEVAPAMLADAVPTAAAAVSAPDNWSLLDDDAVMEQEQEPAGRAHPREFGIEKLSAADYLAPVEEGQGDSPITPGLTLELVSIEEAIAPRHYEPNEMLLDEFHSVLGRVVMLGATTESTASVCEFLSGLPAGLELTLLHTQHLAGRPAGPLAEHLAAHCALPVRLAEKGMRARAGEVLVVPSDHQVRLLRDGKIELQPADAGSPQQPSIDASFTMAAGAFGRDALAIVFAGQSTDAVAGCQAIHDRGGQVWVEASSGEHFADMVSGVMAERLSHYAGTPRELAARLVEQFSKESQR
ncbi:hypothetical protein ASG87_08180 [Frateuria sp. Soil773]|uniref:chemotaxis protein CheB n=1 Tax=Frateuria sp. Soil773 TaxID=1736407 RepID=UPI0006F46E09|nr:chemotaxis protein CheB [Frateuria sp. Soil773]KRE88552.1 hypothetical protein ASG87_08180 [Frateuria sp. Soil773]